MENEMTYKGKTQEEWMDAMRKLCKPGEYTVEELEGIKTRGSKYIANWIDCQIMKEIIALGEDTTIDREGEVIKEAGFSFTFPAKKYKQ